MFPFIKVRYLAIVLAMDEAVTGNGAFEVIVDGLVGEAADTVQQMEEDVVKELE